MYASIVTSPLPRLRTTRDINELIQGVKPHMCKHCKKILQPIYVHGVHIEEKSHLYTSIVISASTNRQVARDID